MPGIEYYTRKEPGGSLPLPPAQCASLLFSALVEGGETLVLESEQKRFQALPSFDNSAFERLRFTYLVANIAVILTPAASKDPKVTQIIFHFRELVRRAMRERWRDSEESADRAIEEAGAAYAALVFTNPETNRAISFEWSQQWLGHIGIEEYNPVTLFKIAHTWRDYHVHAVRFFTALFRGEQTNRQLSSPKVNIYEGESPLVFGIPRDDVVDCDISTVGDALRGFLQSRDRVIRGRGRVTLFVQGYDDDPRELYDRPEVRCYLAALDAAFPYWFYFADTHSDTLKLLASCLCRVVKVPGGATPDKDELKRFIGEHILALNRLCDEFSLGGEVKLAATNVSLQQLVPSKEA